MIGPSSTTETASNREPDRSPSGTKRKAFDDLDIEDFCNEIYPEGKKQFLPELGIPIDELSSQIIQSSELSPSDINSMTKLEVLVVDGMWDNDNFDQTELTDLSSGTFDKRSEDNEMVQGESVEMNLEQSVIWNTPSAKQVAKSGGSKVAKKFGNSLPMCNPVEDPENGNLSWLLDFKLDSFIDAPDDKYKAPVKSNKVKLSRNNTSYSSAKKLTNSDNSVSNQNYPTSRANSQKKPPFTYTELIEHALQEKGELTVSAIYQWISDHFPYYKSNDDRWKNSVRHNLSINPHFRKGSKAPHGAGHLWAIANQDESKTRHLLNGNNIISRHILNNLSQDEDLVDNTNVQSKVPPLDEVAAATASIIQLFEEEEKDRSQVVGSFSLEHSAERILSGLKRDVEVQYLIPMMVSESTEESSQNENSVQHCSSKETDFLNPVSKEVVAEECGLIEEGYLITDLNPAVLGLNLTDPEVVSPENLFGEELSFQFYELTSPSQLQSA